MGYKKMDPGVKRRWVEALRSGRYRQMRGALRYRRSTNAYGYCCLGVLCNLTDPAGWGNEYGGRRVQHRGCNALPGRDVLRKTGLGKYEMMTLARINDVGYVKRSAANRHANEPKGRSFDEIATWIERNL